MDTEESLSSPSLNASSQPFHNHTTQPPPGQEDVQMQIANLQTSNLPPLSLAYPMDHHHIQGPGTISNDLPPLPLSPDHQQLAHNHNRNHTHNLGHNHGHGHNHTIPMLTTPGASPPLQHASTTSPFAFPSANGDAGMQPMQTGSSAPAHSIPTPSALQAAPIASRMPSQSDQVNFAAAQAQQQQQQQQQQQSLNGNNNMNGTPHPPPQSMAHLAHQPQVLNAMQFHPSSGFSVSSPFEAMQSSMGINNAMEQSHQQLVNSQQSHQPTDLLESVPSGYATPQSNTTGYLEYNNQQHQASFMANGLNGSAAAAAVGPEDRNFAILELAHRLQQSAMFLTQAVQEGKEMEVEHQLAHVDHLHALFQPLRNSSSSSATGSAATAGAPRLGPGASDPVSSPSSAASGSIPPPPGFAQQNQQQQQQQQRPTKSPSDEIRRELSQHTLNSRPPSPRMQQPTPQQPPPHGAVDASLGQGLGLGLDTAEATRKRCASAVTDGDRVIKSLKREAAEPPSSNNNNMATTPTSATNGAHPSSLLSNLSNLPPLQTMGQHQQQASNAAAYIPTMNTPLSDTMFSAHGQLAHPLTPASSVSGHPPFFLPSNPPSAPASRPTSPHGKKSRRGTLSSQHAPHSHSHSHTHSHPHNASQAHQHATLHPPLMVSGNFNADQRTMSWPDLNTLHQHSQMMNGQQYSAALQQAAMSSIANPFPSPTRSTFSSPSGSASAHPTPMRVRPSRSSSYSRDMRIQPLTPVNGFGGPVPPPLMPSVMPLKVEDYESELLVPSHAASFTISAPHSPDSSSDDSLDWPHGSTVTPYDSLQNSADPDLYASVMHVPSGNYPGSEIPPEFSHDVERIFFEFLNRICSNLEATDAKGEPIHQTLMAKKMQRLDESPDFRPFKFRIQAFTNAFMEELAKQGYPEEKIPMKKVRGYLWIQPFISRYNEDGKKSKSKGNHIWNIDAKKRPEGGWIFRKFQRKIAGSPPGVAYEGLAWSYKPHIWDPQQSRRNDTVQYSSPWLPPWLHWEGDTLCGIPSDDAQGIDITIDAQFQENGEDVRLTCTFHLTVAPLNAGDVNSLNPLGLQVRPSISGDNGLSRRMNSDTMVQSISPPSRPLLPRHTTRMDIPRPAGPSRVVEVLNDTKDRIVQSQNVASLSFADPHMHASLSRQHHVLNVATTAIEENAYSTDDNFDVQTSAIANVGTQFVASTVEALQQERRTFGAFPHATEQNITVQDVSAVTHSALAQAVDSLPHNSNEVEVLMAAKALVQTTRSANPIREPQLSMNNMFNIPQGMAYAPGSANVVLPTPST